MPSVDELKMTGEEIAWWERVRERGSLWYLATKGLFFLLAYPSLGWGLLGWEWDAWLLVEGWLLGLVSGGVVWMRKELRYRFTLDREGRPLPDA